MRFSSSFKVGILTLAGLIILLFSIMWVKGRSLSAGERLEIIFKDVNGSSKTISANYAKNIESVSFGIVNNDYTSSDIYVDNLRLLKNIGYTTNTRTAID